MLGESHRRRCETLRSLPFKDSEESRLQAGPAVEASVIGTPWLVDPWDVRLEAHVLIVGAHLAVNLAEMFDLFAGLLTFDPRADDMIGPRDAAPVTESARATGRSRCRALR